MADEDTLISETEAKLEELQARTDEAFRQINDKRTVFVVSSPMDNPACPSQFKGGKAFFELCDAEAELSRRRSMVLDDMKAAPSNGKRLARLWAYLESFKITPMQLIPDLERKV